MIGLAWAAVLILAGGIVAILAARWNRVADRVYGISIVAGAIAGALPALEVLAGAEPRTGSLPGSLPGGPWTFALDPLSSWFVVVILAVGAASAIFGIGYLASERRHRPIAGAHFLFAILLTALLGVVTAQAVAPFLASWEIMALAAYLLVIHENEKIEIRRAGLIYLVLTHLSTLALIGMFAALSVHAAEPTFAAMAAGNRVGTVEGSLALVFGLVGFGVKAGVVPAHFWLPGAHAAAPSHVSAVLSGVMLKMGIYGLLRLTTMLGTPPPWFGWTLLGLGLISGILGVVWALNQPDLKRLLAYHSVENVGIILIGLGVGTLGLFYHRPVVATLGLMGAILHVANHALFKSLLFLGAGAILRATGTRMIDRLGGLARRIPLVALTFGIASIAIVGLPPLNGFVSEWLVFGGLFSAADSTSPLRFAVFGAAGLGLIGGLALACFAKIDGVMFLGQPRHPSSESGNTERPGVAMLLPMLALATLCVSIGVWPGLVLRPTLRATSMIVGTAPGALAITESWIAAAEQISVVSIGLILVVTGMVAIRWLLQRSRAVRVADTWACAGQPATARMQYTASSFASPLLTSFAPVVGGWKTQMAGAPPHGPPPDLIQERFAVPAWRRIRKVGQRLREWQGGRLRWYLFSVVATLLALLFHLARWKGGSQ